MKIILGPAGSPSSSTIDGIKVVKELGLGAMEVQFSHGIRMSLELASIVGKEARKEGIKLSVHAPYYINLASADAKIVAASRNRIIDTCQRAQLMGARCVIFHPGYYGENVNEKIKKEIISLIKTNEKNGWDVQLCPETTGRKSQFGSLEEILLLSKETGCSYCIDVSHILAREGSVDYDNILERLPEGHTHFHFAGIEYGTRGEKRHLICNKEEFKIFAQAIMKNKRSSTIISESPITWKDSLMMKAVFQEFGYEF